MGGGPSCSWWLGAGRGARVSSGLSRGLCAPRAAMSRRLRHQQASSSCGAHESMYSWHRALVLAVGQCLMLEVVTDPGSRRPPKHGHIVRTRPRAPILGCPTNGGLLVVGRGAWAPRWTWGRGSGRSGELRWWTSVDSTVIIGNGRRPSCEPPAVWRAQVWEMRNLTPPQSFEVTGWQVPAADVVSGHTTPCQYHRRLRGLIAAPVSSS